MLKKNCLKYKASDLKQWLYITYRAILPLKPHEALLAVIRDTDVSGHHALDYVLVGKDCHEWQYRIGCKNGYGNSVLEFLRVMLSSSEGCIDNASDRAMMWSNIPMGLSGESVSISSLSSGILDMSAMIFSPDFLWILGDIEKKQPHSANGLM